MDILGIVFMLAGTAFVVVAGLGMLRLPDIFTRMHASTKAGTLGVALIALSAVFFYGSISVLARAVALVLFVMLTAPVAAHMIGRAAHASGVPLWNRTLVDEKRAYDSARASGDGGPVEA